MAATDIRFVELTECSSGRDIYVNPRQVLAVEQTEDYEYRKSSIVVYNTPDRHTVRVFGSADEVARQLSGANRLM